MSASPRLRGSALVAGAALALLALAGCGGSGPLPSPPGLPSGPDATGASAYSKVLVVVEENKTFDQVLGSRKAPYLDLLAARYASAQAMDAGYPAVCPSLAAYLLMTGGDRGLICDDADPAAHPLPGPNIFQQVAASGQEWRSYAESMPVNCTLTNHGHFLVRHVPAGYYLTERQRCQVWDVPAGSPTAGALHDDVAAGRLPAYSMVVPDACHDMHGAFGCRGDDVTAGDTWLATWLPQLLSGPDYRAGRLVIVITWDEGSSSDNHIPSLVVAPTANQRAVRQPLTHCSMLRLAEELLRLPLLGCARDAAPARAAFGLS